jgi:large subunit ribosomal protein L18
MTNQKTTRRKQRHRRVRGQISGSADKPRLSVYRSNRHMYAQLIDDDAGETIAAASSLEMGLDGSLKEKAKAVGEAVAERGQKEDVKEVVFDRGGYDYGGRVEALADAARDNGLDF